MKILYISNAFENSGWGNASFSNIMALESTGVDLVLRNLSFGGKQKKINPRILALAEKPIHGVDICIQHTLPTLYCYNGACKNIGFYETETTDFNYSMWHKYINMMDYAWVPTELNKSQSQNSGVDIPIQVINHCLELDRYYNLEKTANVSELEGSYNFCFVGELSKRKNIPALLRAFYTEFHPTENVNLLLKLNSPGHNESECMNQFQILNRTIKDGLKIRSVYKDPIVITRHETQNDLLSIVSQCHCFISTSYGEAWCIPALEALALGLNVLYTAGTGTEEFCFNNHAHPVKSKQTPCFGSIDSLPEIYSSHDNWMDIDIQDLRFCMRNMFEQKNTKNRKDISKSVLNFDYKVVGNKMMEVLNAI